MQRQQGQIYFPPEKSDVIPGRPGCVTVYALLFFGMAALVIWSYISAASAGTVAERMEGQRQMGTVLLALTGAVILLQTVGLLLMRRWGVLLSLAAFVLVIANFIAFWVLGPNYPLIDGLQWRWARENMAVMIGGQVIFGLFLLWATRWVARQRARFA